jgi:hypothetical protein
MAALTTERNTPKRNDGVLPEQYSLPIAASTKPYQGGITCINSAGYAVPGSATVGLRAVGKCRKTVDNSAGAAGDLNVDVESGVFRFANSTSTDAISQADALNNCWIVDDQTVARTSNGGTRSVAGRVIQVDADGVWVEIGLAADRTVVDIMGVAAADLSSLQNTFVKMTSSGVAAAAAAGESCIGVLINAPLAGAIAIVRMHGQAQVKSSASIAAGVDVATTNVGLSKAAVAATTNTSDAGASADALVGSFVMGTAITAGAGSSALHTVFVQRMGAIPTTAA